MQNLNFFAQIFTDTSDITCTKNFNIVSTNGQTDIPIPVYPLICCGGLNLMNDQDITLKVTLTNF